MTLDELKIYVRERFKLGYPLQALAHSIRAYEVILAAESSGQSRMCFDVQLDAVPDRDFGKPVTALGFRVHMPLTAVPLLREVDVRTLLRAILQSTAEHEVDEAILVDGQRVFDPHEKRAA